MQRARSAHSASFLDAVADRFTALMMSRRTPLHPIEQATRGATSVARASSLQAQKLDDAAAPQDRCCAVLPSHGARIGVAVLSRWIAACRRAHALGELRNGPMTKIEIARVVHDRVEHLSLKEAADLVELVFETMKEILGRGEKVKIAGFGNLVLRDKRERRGRNPQTGEPMVVAARRVLTRSLRRLRGAHRGRRRARALRPPSRRQARKHGLMRDAAATSAADHVAPPAICAGSPPR